MKVKEKNIVLRRLTDTRNFLFFLSSYRKEMIHTYYIHFLVRFSFYYQLHIRWFDVMCSILNISIEIMLLLEIQLNLPSVGIQQPREKYILYFPNALIFVFCMNNEGEKKKTYNQKRNDEEEEKKNANILRKDISSLLKNNKFT